MHYSWRAGIKNHYQHNSFHTQGIRLDNQAAVFQVAQLFINLTPKKLTPFQFYSGFIKGK